MTANASIATVVPLYIDFGCKCTWVFLTGKTNRGFTSSTCSSLVSDNVPFGLQGILLSSKCHEKGYRITIVV